MQVGKNAGAFLGWGIVAYLIGGGIFFSGWINNLTASRYSQQSDGPVIVGAILLLVGTGLVISGIYKVARNIEISTVANVSAEDHLRWMRDSMLAQQQGALPPGPAATDSDTTAEDPSVPDDRIQ